VHNLAGYAIEGRRMVCRVDVRVRHRVRDVRMIQRRTNVGTVRIIHACPARKCVSQIVEAEVSRHGVFHCLIPAAAKVLRLERQLGLIGHRWNLWQRGAVGRTLLDVVEHVALQEHRHVRQRQLDPVQFQLQNVGLAQTCGDRETDGSSQRQIGDFHELIALIIG